MSKLDELENFNLEAFSNEAGKPDPKFKETLKQELLKDFEKKSFIASLFSKNYAVKFALASVIVVIIFAGYSVGSYRNMLNKSTLTNNKTFTSEEKSKIFENIIKNNTANVIQKNQAVAETPVLDSNNSNLSMNNQNLNTDSTVTKESNKISSQQLPVIVKPEGENYNYRYTKTSSEAGPSIDKCIIYGATDYNIVSESFEYFTTDKSYLKNISKNKDGNLVDYKFTTETNNVYENIEYKGGKFAIKTKYNSNAFADFTNGESPVSYPATEMANVKSLSEMYFGQNTEVTETIDNGGTEYYLLKSEFNLPCLTKDSTLTNSKVDKYQSILYVYWVNAKTFEVNKYEEYLDSQSTENLILTTEITRIVENMSKDTSDKSFTFEYEVPIEEIDLTDSNKVPTNEQILNFLSTNKISIITPKDQEIDSIWIMQENYYRQYYLNRDFYLPGADGDKLFNEAKESLSISDQIRPKTVLSFKPIENLTSLAIYNANIEDSDIIKTYFEDFYDNSTDIEITIDNAKVTAKLYQQTNKYPVSFTSSNTTRMIIFEYSGYKYAFTINTQAEVKEFISYNSDIDKILPFNQ